MAHPSQHTRQPRLTVGELIHGTIGAVRRALVVVMSSADDERFEEIRRLREEASRCRGLAHFVSDDLLASKLRVTAADLYEAANALVLASRKEG